MTDTDIKSLGNRIRQAREALGISARQLGTRAAVHHGHIARLENGETKNPSLEMLHKIANALSMNLNELLGSEGAELNSALPEPRVYFRRKFGVSADEADVLTKLVEKYQEEREGEDNGKDD